MGQLKSTLYARMEEVSFRAGAVVAGGVLTAAGVAITLAVVLGGHSDAVASASASRAAVPSAVSPVLAPVSSSPPATPPSPTPRPSRTATRDRGRDLPAAIGDPGVRDPACCGDSDSGPHLHLASPGPARPATRGVARMAELAQVTALAVEPVPPPPPPLTTGLERPAIIEDRNPRNPESGPYSGTITSVGCWAVFTCLRGTTGH